jgi:hypothetical protein
MYFSYQRTALQAVGWYLTFLLAGFFIATTRELLSRWASRRWKRASVSADT